MGRLRERYKADEIPKGSFRLAAVILGTLSVASFVGAALLPEISLAKSYVSLLVGLFSGFLATQNELFARGTSRASAEERVRAKRLVEKVSKEKDLQAPYLLVVGISDRLLGLPFIGKRLKRFAAAGGLFGIDILIMGTPLMRRLNNEQLCGVIDHELTHSKMHHSSKRLIGLLPQVWASKVRDYFFYAALFGAGISWRSVAIASGLVLATRQVRMWVLRRHERQADRGAALGQHGEGLAQALEILAPAQTTHRLPVRCALWLRDMVVPPYNSHPRAQWRVAEIRRLAAQSHATPVAPLLKHQPNYLKGFVRCMAAACAVAAIIAVPPVLSRPVDPLSDVSLRSSQVIAIDQSSQAQGKELVARINDPNALSLIQAERAEAVLEHMNAQDQAAFQNNLDLAGSSTERGYLYKALAANRTLPDIAKFESATKGKSTEELHLLLDPVDLNTPYGQVDPYAINDVSRWYMCQTVSAVLIRLQTDPIEALALSDSGVLMPRVATKPMTPGVVKEETLISRRESRITMEIVPGMYVDSFLRTLNSFTPQTGVSYAFYPVNPYSKSNTADLVGDMNSALDQGIPVPFYVGPKNGLPDHIATVLEHRGTDVFVLDSAGVAGWMNESQFVDQKLDRFQTSFPANSGVEAPQVDGFLLPDGVDYRGTIPLRATPVTLLSVLVPGLLIGVPVGLFGQSRLSGVPQLNHALAEVGRRAKRRFKRSLTVDKDGDEVN